MRLKNLMWNSWDHVSHWAGRAYVSGPQLEDALAVSRHGIYQRASITLGYWDGPQDSPAQVASSYLKALDRLREARSEFPDAYVSLKAPPLNYDPAWTKIIMDHSRDSGVRVHFDSHGPESADQTFNLIELGRSREADVGCTLPGRWHRSLRDADWAVDRHLRVRVVKGQWPHPLHPSFDARLGFLQVIDRLLGRARHVAVATHDGLLLQNALSRLLDAKTPCDVELLYGLPMEPAYGIARRAGIPIRFYIPFGYGRVPYNLSQVPGQPKMMIWMLRDLIGSGGR